MAAAAKNQADTARLRADLAAAAVELLSAQCAADRIRLQYSPQDVVALAEPQTLKKALASVDALCTFFSQIATQFKHKEEKSSS